MCRPYRVHNNVTIDVRVRDRQVGEGTARTLFVLKVVFQVVILLLLRSAPLLGAAVMILVRVVMFVLLYIANKRRVQA